MIAGLHIYDNFITENEEHELINYINNSEWNNELKRRTQHYGYKYPYDKTNILEKYKDIPIWCNNTIKKVSNLINSNVNQIIINEYNVGQGISPHIDNIKLFDNTIASLGLGSDCIMNFSHDDNVIPILFKRRTLIVLKDDARYIWKHSIPARSKDNGIKRNKRISITFRKTL